VAINIIQNCTIISMLAQVQFTNGHIEITPKITLYTSNTDTVITQL